MEIVSIVLLLLLAVVLSGTLSRMLPVSIPTPLVQIALGAVIGMSTSHRVELDPELFLLLFLPPLLFLDGWRIPKDELLKDLSTIVELALGLVLLTVIGMGYFIHWMIPAMPLAVAFALAAVVSPTDPIAVSAIATRVSVPKRMMHILEGESLLNDGNHVGRRADDPGGVGQRHVLPARDLAIFLAAGVIIVPLVAAAVGLPILLNGLTMPAEPTRQAEEDAASVASAEAAIRAIEQRQHALAETRDDPDYYIAAGTRVMYPYRERIDWLAGERSDLTRAQERLVTEFRLLGVKAERQRLLALARERTIGSEMLRKLTRELDLSEARYRG